jgi:hypothetical protein
MSCSKLLVMPLEGSVPLPEKNRWADPFVVCGFFSVAHFFCFLSSSFPHRCVVVDVAFECGERKGRGTRACATDGLLTWENDHQNFRGSACGGEDERFSCLRLRLRRDTQAIHCSRKTIAASTSSRALLQKSRRKVTSQSHERRKHWRNKKEYHYMDCESPELAITTSLEQRNTEGAI